MISPTQRSKSLFMEQRYTVAVCEKWIERVGKRVDLFGCFDLVAIREDVVGVLGIQTTTGSNLSARVNKLLESRNIRVWLLAENRVIVHGWRKLKNQLEGRWWHPKIVELKLQSGELISETR